MNAHLKQAYVHHELASVIIIIIIICAWLSTLHPCVQNVV